MKLVLKLMIAATALLSAVQANAQVSFGEAVKFNEGWTFHKEGSDKIQNVTLPHDWSIKEPMSPNMASCMGFLPGGIGYYEKKFDGSLVTKDLCYIYFEGVYNRSEVSLNGHLLGKRPNGFVSFMYDLTPYLNRSGENTLSVKVDHSLNADCRWYTGSGIYRDVWMVQAGKVHFAQWGVGYNTEVNGKDALVKVDAAIEGLDGKYKLALTLKDAQGNIVAKSTTAAKDSQTIVLKVKEVKLWELDNPYLYTLSSEILSGKEVIDRCQINVGVRTLAFDANKGFFLNGKNTKVKGVCVHHEAGVLGAAVPDEVWERRFQVLKSIGTNAIRCSHNPQAPVFYDLADRMGFLVLDEISDEWEFPKNKWIDGWNVGVPGHQGTSDFFEEWIDRDVTDMVRRDRNHPCIFMWSIGNEVDYPNDPYSHPILDGDVSSFVQPINGGYKPDAPNAMRIGVIAKRLAADVRAIDSSRPVTGALAGVIMSNQTEYPQAIDVCGYNYTESMYDSDHAKYPERIIYGSENSSSYKAWKDCRDREFIFGQFIWTGIEYLGESHGWPSRGSTSGIIDLAGFLKPSAHFRAAMWCEHPVAYLGTATAARRWSPSAGKDIWNYEPGEKVRAICYTNAAQARLLLNGKEVGQMKPFDDNLGFISWELAFEPGTLKVECCDNDGKCTASYEIKTSLRPCSLSATADKSSLKEGEVAHVIINVLDDNGNEVRLADNAVTCLIEGPAQLLGLENADNRDTSGTLGFTRRAYNGRLVAYIKKTAGEGPVTVKFTSPLLKGTSVKF